MREPETPPGPIVVSGPDAVSWDDEADVVIVGFGGAGAAAAIEARDRGADVLAIDRFDGGGATSFSGGILYAGGTKHQAASGFNDTPEEMFKYLRAENSPVRDDTLRRFCEGSNGDLEWLEANGVPYGSNAYLEKTTHPPNGHWLYYSGNEKLPAFKAKAKPAPRGHRPLTPGQGGHLHYAKLRQSALAKGVRVLPHAPATQLIVDTGGAVIGVEVNALPEALWERHRAFYAVINPWRPFHGKRSERAVADCNAFEQLVNSPRRIRAHGGVILSAGGFIYNLDILRRHRDVLARNFTGLLRLGSLGCDGSGIELGRAAGGTTALMDHVFLGRSIAPPEAFVDGIIVNAKGERFSSEDAYISALGEAISRQPDNGRAWLILDRASFWEGIKQSLFPGAGRFWIWGAPALLNVLAGGTKRAETARALAQKIKVDGAELERTLATFNAAAASGTADPLGKSPDRMRALAPPFYAVNVSLINQFGPTFAFTLGGLVVDEETGEVKRADGSVIRGLYAAGRSAVGLCSNSYMSGMSIADTVFSGRRAARDAVRKLNPQAAPQQSASIAT